MRRSMRGLEPDRGGAGRMAGPGRDEKVDERQRLESERRGGLGRDRRAVAEHQALAGAAAAATMRSAPPPSPGAPTARQSHSALALSSTIEAATGSAPR